jgi:ubiquinone/menaquinone biosynthesis C-methylase UbiE
MSRDLDDYQNLYQSQPFEFHQVRQRKKLILELLTKQRPGRILEVGCGLESIFLDYGDFEHAVIVEPASDFHRQAVEQFTDVKNKITIFKGTLEDVSPHLNNFNFDLIIISSLIHEITELSKFMETIVKLAKKTTIVHFNVPNAHSFHRLLAQEMGIIKSVFEKSKNNIQFQQNTVFSMDNLIDLVQKNGFEVIDKGSCFIKPFTHEQMQKMLDNKIINEDVLIGLNQMTKYLPNLGSEIYINAKLKF